MTRRFVIALAALGALTLALSCSSGALGANGTVDPETGERMGPRPHRAIPKAQRVSDIPSLSLEGISLPVDQAADGKQAREPGKTAQPAPVARAQGLSRPGPAAPPPADAGDDEAGLPPRNLFAFEQDPAVILAQRRQAQEAAEKAAEAAKKAQWLKAHTYGPPPPPPPPQPPAIPFSFIGYFGPADNRLAVFQTQGSNVLLLARKGETVLNQFRVVDIGYESAEIGFQGFKETRRIPLIGGGK
ncbi:MAG: hypothetical protein ACP5VF_00455 [Acidobacteriota bacterium]